MTTPAPRAAVCGTLLFLTACGGSTRSARHATVSPQPSHGPSEVQPPTRDLAPYEHQPLWIQARDGDDLDRMRLADALGAAGLIEGFEAGGWVRQVALSALPHAPDAELGLAPLCDALGEGDAGGQLLSAVHGIASQPPRQVEATDVTGYASCRAPLAALADQKSLPPGRRDLAHAALDALLSRQQSRN